MNLADGPWRSWRTAPVNAVAAWLAEDVDEPRIADLLAGLVLARIPIDPHQPERSDFRIPPAWAVLKPLFTTREQLERVGVLGPSSSAGGGTAVPGARDTGTIVRLLAANRVADAVERGSRRLRAWGTPALASFEHAGQPDGRRLLATLLVPIRDADLRRAVHRVARRAEERQPITSTTDTEA